MKLKIAFAAMIAAAALAPSLGAQSATMKEAKPGLLKKAKITSENAAATAQALVPKGKLAGAEIEEENGKLVYSFEFKTDGKTGSDEVLVDALTGKQVGKVEHESPAAEKKEAKADSGKATKKPAAKKP